MEEVGAKGLCQWLGGRADGLDNYAQSKGVSWKDVDTQIEFLIAEITGEGPASKYASKQFINKEFEGRTYGFDEWKNAENVEDATVAFCISWERPGIGEANLERRKSKAKDYLNNYKDKVNEGASPSSTNGWMPSTNQYIHGSFTTNGKTFYMPDQSRISGWGGYCNRAVALCLMSGLTGRNEAETINGISETNKYCGSYLMSGSGTYSYFNRYGITAQVHNIGGGDYRNYLKSTLTSGGYCRYVD